METVSMETIGMAGIQLQSRLNMRIPSHLPSEAEPY